MVKGHEDSCKEVTLIKPMVRNISEKQKAEEEEEKPKSIDDYEMIKQLDKGAYGNVWMAKEKSTGDMYAIKVLYRNNKHVMKLTHDQIMEEYNMT